MTMTQREAAGYEANDPTFVQDLMDSKAAVNRAAEWLSCQGYPVVVRPTFVRPDASKMSDYGDDGDIEIMQRVEVKRRNNLDFTCADDYPYQTVIVDVCHTYDNARPKPYAYIIFNKFMTHAAIVFCRTRPQWSYSRKTDRNKGRDRTFYECPKALVHFISI